MKNIVLVGQSAKHEMFYSALMMSLAMQGNLLLYDNHTINGKSAVPDRIKKNIAGYHHDFPWSSIHISSKQRKGKTFEELQEMRKAIYEKRLKNK